MPIKGLFNRDENNVDEIQKLSNRVQAIEQQVRKVNTLDVHMKRLLQLENERKKEDFSTKHAAIKERKEVSRESNRKETLQRETLIAMEKRLILELSKYISQKLAPIQKELNRLEDRIAIMESHFSLMKESVKENNQQISDLKDELERVKIDPSLKKEEQPLVIREIKVDKILLDKYEQNNNFGSVGIKDLSGELNIGATYGKTALPAEIAEDLKADFESFKNDIVDTAEESSDESSSEQNVESKNQSLDDDDDFTEIPIN